MYHADLVAEWRKRAMDLRRYGAVEAAASVEACADDLEECVRIWETEPLTLQEAAEASGYSADHLGRFVREGKIPNAGRPGAPRIRRADLRLKPMRVAKPREGCDSTNAQVVQSIIDRGVA